MTWPCQPVDCEAYSRSGSTGEPFRWYISQPAKSGPSTFQSSRVPSDVRMNAPLRVPTRSLTPLIRTSFSIDQDILSNDVRRPRFSTASARTARPAETHRWRRSEAERAGFEPATDLSARTRFPVALLRPLGHLSAAWQRSVA